MSSYAADPDIPTGPYTSAILIALFSLLVIILISPPMLWHASNRNIGATSLILWLLVLNLQGFLNASIWSHDDIPRWFGGHVFCDVEVKIQIASFAGVPASVACILKALARVMDTDRVSLGLTKRQKRVGYAVDLLWCVGFPALQMLFHYIVQSARYYVMGILGCMPAVSNNWVTDVLIFMPPAAWTLFGGYYAVLVLVRMHRYRRNFTSLLANSNTNKSRFVRLFAIGVIWIVVSIPLQAYVIHREMSAPHDTFRWSEVHDPKLWATIEKFPSGGQVVYTQYIWLGSAFMVFLFFGFGREASRMYAKGLRAVGLGRCFPFLNNDSPTPRNASTAGTLSSVGSKARMLFRRKSSSATSAVKSWATDSRSSKATSSSMAEPLSPKTINYMETVREGSGQTTPAPVAKPAASRISAWLGGRRVQNDPDVEKNLPTADSHFQSSLFRLTTPFRPVSAMHRAEERSVPMSIMKTQDVTVHSTAANGPLSPAYPVPR